MQQGTNKEMRQHVRHEVQNFTAATSKTANQECQSVCCRCGAQATRMVCTISAHNHVSVTLFCDNCYVG